MTPAQYHEYQRQADVLEADALRKAQNEDKEAPGLEVGETYDIDGVNTGILVEINKGTRTLYFDIQGNHPYSGVNPNKIPFDIDSEFTLID